MKKDDVIDARKYSINQRSQLKNDGICGCFYCKKIFNPSEIKEWVDNEYTPLCPYCGIDSVIGESSEYPITEEFLDKMHNIGFNRKPAPAFQKFHI